MGKGNRIDEHVKTKKKNVKDVDRVISSIFKCNQEPIRFKLYENISVDSAKRLERCLIKMIGRKDLNEGPLANLTNGGEGFIGFHDKEWILVRPNNEEYIIEKLSHLGLFDFKYQSFKMKDGVRMSEDGWILKEKLW